MIYNDLQHRYFKKDTEVSFINVIVVETYVNLEILCVY